MKEAMMVYKCPGPHEIHGGNFDYKIVDAAVEGEVEKAQEEGWHLTTTDAKEAHEAAKKGPTSDDAPPTREEMEAKAKELGLVFPANISDAKLLEKIDAKLAESKE